SATTWNTPCRSERCYSGPSWGSADLVGQTLQHRLRGGVRVDIDKARQDRKATAVDLDSIAVFGWPGRADRGDRLRADRQIDIAAIAVGLRRLVPGDEPGGIADNCARRGWFERIGHGIPSKQSPWRCANPAQRKSPSLYLAWAAGLGCDRSLSR